MKIIEGMDEVNFKMYDEGFHYCFDGYSDWDEIKDKKFHKLRLKYIESAQKLKDYISQHSSGAK